MKFQDDLKAKDYSVHYSSGVTGNMEDTAVGYIVVTKQSNFTVRAFATGLLSAFGHNPTIAIRDFEGTIVLDSSALEKSSFRIVLHSASLVVTDDIAMADREEIERRMQEEVLESEFFPDIVYDCSRVSASKTGAGQYWMALNGDLSLHGVIRSQPISARVSLSGDTLRAMGDFSVRQSDYKIRPVSAAGGTVKLKDELKLAFDIFAHKQAS